MLCQATTNYQPLPVGTLQLSLDYEISDIAHSISEEIVPVSIKPTCWHVLSISLDATGHKKPSIGCRRFDSMNIATIMLKPWSYTKLKLSKTTDDI